ncbi:hypothetical protein Tco_0866902, partial [Tanacetum coccineum]
MTTLKFADSHNMVAFLSKPTESEGFEQIVDFLNAHPIKYALTVNPTIYASCIEQFWSTVKAKMVNGVVQLQALVDGKMIMLLKHLLEVIFNWMMLMKQKPRKPSRKNTEVPQPSGSPDNVADETVYKERDDSLVRAVTTASSLEAEQDS